jgi:C_GCAxxG_C_C family probable redox protein
MKRSDQAVACFKEGFSCSQAVFSAYAGDKMDRETALKVSGAFGGGMARMGQTCGCITGAMMLIGLKHGMTVAKDEAAKARTYVLVKYLVDEFKLRNGSIVCRELLGCDISTAEGFKEVEEKKLIATRCPKFVRDAAEIVEKVLI